MTSGITEVIGASGMPGSAELSRRARTNASDSPCTRERLGCGSLLEVNRQYRGWTGARCLDVLLRTPFAAVNAGACD
jgi:hypothetical protein